MKISSNKDVLISGLPAIRKTKVKIGLEDRWAREIRNRLLVQQLRAVFDVESNPNLFDKPMSEKIARANEMAKMLVREKNDREGTNDEAYTITEEDYRAVVGKIELSVQLKEARNVIFFKHFTGQYFREDVVEMRRKALASEDAKKLMDFYDFGLRHRYSVQKLMGLEKKYNRPPKPPRDKPFEPSKTGVVYLDD